MRQPPPPTMDQRMARHRPRAKLQRSQHVGIIAISKLNFILQPRTKPATKKPTIPSKPAQ